MKAFTTLRTAMLAGTLVLGSLAATVLAQDANVRIGIVQVGNELEVRFLPDQSLNLPVSASQFTVKWNNPAVNLGTAQWVSTDVATYMQGIAFGTMYLGSLTTGTDGSTTYHTFTQFNNTAGANAIWTANAAVPIMRIPIVNPTDECVVFSVEEDAYMAANNVEFYMTLGVGPETQTDVQDGTFTTDVAPVVNENTGATYCTIQSAIDDPLTLDGHVIKVGPGTFAENVVVNKALDLHGANQDEPCGARTFESLIAPATGLPVHITVDGVTLNGFEITAPVYQYAILCGGLSDLVIAFNHIHDINSSGSPALTPTHAIQYTVANAPSAATTVSIVDNCIADIASSALTGNSASAIGFLQSTTTGTLTGLEIARNSISNVAVNTSIWPTGKIAYGIQLNAGGGGGYLTSTGKIVDAMIVDNEIDGLSGFIATGIGLEGNTENASVTGNSISNLTAYKSANRAGGGLDLNALKFENNRYVATCTVENNSFATNTFEHDGTPGLGYGIANYVPLGQIYGTGTTGPATTTCNWFGTDVFTDIQDNDDLDGKILNKAGAATTFSPFLTNGTDNAAATGFQPVPGSCVGGPVRVYADNAETVLVSAHGTIQAAVDEASTLDGYVVRVDAGSYAETIIVGKSLDFRGANYGINPNTDMRVGETIIHPPNTGVFVYNLDVDADDVRIDGFLFDGDNPLLTSGYTNTTGADIDGASAIDAYYGGTDGLVVQNNIIRNYFYFGVTIYPFYDSGNGGAGTPSSGHVIAGNRFEDLGTYDTDYTYNGWGGSVLVHNNAYAQVENNVMTNVRMGVQTGNFYQPTPDAGFDHGIRDNEITTRRRGIFHNLAYSNASLYPVENNSVTGLMHADETVWDGILLSSLSVPAQVNGNTVNVGDVTNPSEGIEVWNVAAGDPVAISGGSVTGTDIGIFLNNFEGYATNATNGAHATITGVDINATTTGIRLLDSPNSTSNAAVQATINNCFINGGADGVLLEETLAGTVTGTINDNSITGQSSLAIVNAGTNTADATCNWFGTANAVLLPALVSGDVTLIPFLNSGVDDDGDVTTGFQPEPGACSGVGPVASNLPAATYFTIQAAVDGSDPGATITVDTGNYPESVVVDKAMTLNGANAGTDGCDGGRTDESVIDGHGTAAVTIQSNGVTVDGFQFRGAIGVSSTGFMDALVQNNLVTTREAGISGAAIDTDAGSFAVNNNCIAMENVAYEQQTYDVTPILTPGQTGVNPPMGEWGADRYAPAGFASENFDGDERLKHAISAADCGGCRGGGLDGGFYNTQGRQYNTGQSTAMSVDLYIPSAWETTERRMAGFWATGADAGETTTYYPIIEFTSLDDTDGTGPRFRVWDSGSGWQPLGLPAGFTFDAWYTLHFHLENETIHYQVGDLTSQVSAPGTVMMKNVILQGYNTVSPGVTYDIHWDDLKIHGSHTDLANSPASGIVLAGATGSDALTLADNGISNAFYGHLMSGVNTTDRTTATGGSFTGGMQGVAVVNVTLDGSFSPVTGKVGVNGMTMSGFSATDYPATTGANLQAGVYVFTGGSAPTATVDILVDAVSISGTGNHRQDNAGVSFADFSTGSDPRLIAAVTNSTISGNLNRGVQLRGANATASISDCDVVDNGADPFGLGGNNGYGMIAHSGAELEVTNCHIVNPGSQVDYTVYAIGTGPSPATDITVANSNIDANGNGDVASIVSGGSLTATCNWWGTADIDAIDALVPLQNITFVPYLDDGTDDDPGAPGLQTSANCVNPSRWYVNDNATTGDVYTLAVGNDANVGTVRRPKLTIGAAEAIATDGDTLFVDAGTYEEQVTVEKSLSLLGPNAAVAGTGSRAAEAIVQFPAGAANGSSLIFVNPNVHGVTIAGFDLRCQDATIPNYHQLVRAGGFSAGQPRNNLTIRNNRMYSSEEPIRILAGFGASGGTGLLIEGNYIDCGPNVNAIFGRGMYVGGTSGIIQDNVIENAARGIQYMPYDNATAGLIRRNTVSASFNGLYHNYQTIGAAQVTWEENEVSAAPNPQTGTSATVDFAWTEPVVFHGIYVNTFGTQGTGAAPTALFQNNTINAANPGGTTTTVFHAVYLNNSAAGATANLENNSFTGYTVGVARNTNATGATVNATCNWWGTDDPSTIQTQVSSPNTTFVPWLIDGTDGSANIGFQPVGACAGYPVTLNVQAMLAGPYLPLDGVMLAQVRNLAGFPTTEPYTALGYSDVEVSGPIASGLLAVTGSEAIVDWVLLEVRASGDPSNVLHRRAALIRSNGEVVEVDGTKLVFIWDLPGNDVYHVAIRHRNHLGAMTLNAGFLGVDPLSNLIDFRSVATYGTGAQKQLAPGVKGLWSGNTLGNAQVKYTGPNNDRDPILSALPTISVTSVLVGEYRITDVNLDGLVKYTGANNDRDPILQNIGALSPTSVINQQLP